MKSLLLFLTLLSYAFASNYSNGLSVLPGDVVSVNGNDFVVVHDTYNATHQIVLTPAVRIDSRTLHPYQNNVVASPNAPLVAPTFSLQPISQSVTSLQSFTLEVLASANPGAITYQWYRNGVAISGQTGTNLTFSSPLTVLNAGTYYCRATNSQGTTQSSNAVVAVTVL